MEESIYSKLREYSRGDAYPFHMPGHKRNIRLMDDVYGIDITEIDGFDDLHHAEGMLKEGMERMAAAAGALRSFYVVNGSTCGILAALYACCPRGANIAAARNCHRSAAHGIILKQLKPFYFYPRIVDNMGISGGITCGNIDDIYEKHGDISAVIITSPTYEGIVSDVKGVAQSVHRHGGILIVDEAHGAHLPFGDGKDYPSSAVSCGADIVIQSMHKNLPSLTQTAALHVCSSRVDVKKIEEALRIFETSSPSYVMMAGMDLCVRYMQDEGRRKLKWLSGRLDEFYKKSEAWKELHFLREDADEAEGCSRDKSRIVFSASRFLGMGKELHRILAEEYRLQPEMSTPDYVVLMTMVGDTPEGFERLEKALEEINERLSRKEGKETGIKMSVIQPCEEKVLEPWEAADACEQGRVKTVNTENSEGCICGETVYIYPPGVPFLMPGERIQKEHIEMLRYYSSHETRIMGTRDESGRTIRVITGG